MSGDLSGLLGRLLSQFPQQEQSVRALELWPAISGEAIAAITKAISLKNGVLLVAVSDPMWMNELNLHRTKLIEKLNNSGVQSVSEIRLVYKKLPPPPVKASAPQPPAEVLDKDITIPEIEVEDPQLAEKLAGLFTASKKWVPVEKIIEPVLSQGARAPAAVIEKYFPMKSLASVFLVRSDEFQNFP